MRSLRFLAFFTVCLATAPGGAAQSLHNLHTYASWPNGWRQLSEYAEPRILRIEATRYDFALNLADFGASYFAVRTDTVPGYATALARNSGDLSGLAGAVLRTEIVSGGVTYRANSCRAGIASLSTTSVPLGSARLWESGRYVQHYEIQGLNFVNIANTANTLSTTSAASTLRIVAWPDSLTLTVTVTPTVDLSAGTVFRLSLFSGTTLNLSTEETVASLWPANTSRVLRINYQPSSDNRSTSLLTVGATMAGISYPGVFSAEKNCFVTLVQNPVLDSEGKVRPLARPFLTGYRDIRDYDEIVVTLRNNGTTRQNIPYLLHMRSPANITGHVPIVCDLSGNPLGIPIQLSKNWHATTTMGEYLMAYAYLPAGPGQTQYIIRIPYGFYGTVPSASHAQLSLAGYRENDPGGNGRWDQLAIGCWGETTCFDLDMSLVDVAVADIRHLTAKRGPGEPSWKWTSAGWGGDWLNIASPTGKKIPFGNLKTAYIAHGPCLTEARYNGFYGATDLVKLTAMVRTLRTDDYARTFQHLRYDFQNATAFNASNVWFYRLGSGWDFITPRFSYGNKAGKIEDLVVPVGTAPNAFLKNRQAFTGEGPWWVYLPDADSADAADDAKDKGGRITSGDRAFVVRAYSARFGSNTYAQPHFSARNFRSSADGKGANINALLVPPPEVAQIQNGDFVDMIVELVTLPRAADDYYGGNAAFRAQLLASPSSWETVWREAALNDLQVTVSGGSVLERYPIVVRATSTATTTIKVSITGGLGFVPIRFEGLGFNTGWKLFEEKSDGTATLLDQSNPTAYNNDFWQVDATETPGVFNLVFNLPLDGKPASTWRLER
ncbi:hypothetical protein [Novosphingobium sp.]|uniref:hypothetical protein n=1 Tax=Novosphingobium sp. TaxID=1874826 RepID=UPI00261F1913|nr:hypothetical protein [Novosphingobium sp.]